MISISVHLNDGNAVLRFTFLYIHIFSGKSTLQWLVISYRVGFGSNASSGTSDTFLKIWREGLSAQKKVCNDTTYSYKGIIMDSFRMKLVPFHFGEGRTFNYQELDLTCNIKKNYISIVKYYSFWLGLEFEFLRKWMYSILTLHSNKFEGYF